MQQNAKLPLPIDPYLEQIATACQNHSTVVVKASPGSGKTTRLPMHLARSLGKKVIVLEPRRLAAKLAAERISFEENFKVGEEVGYHFRFDKKFSDRTQLIFYTEGTFLKRLSSDPDLMGVDAVILDEFHERHLETDVALAALRSLQKKRDELRLILMSATIDTRLHDAFPNATIIEIEAPRFPVNLHYLPNQPSVLNQTLEQKIKIALETLPVTGDALTFVPGMREMLKVKDYLGSRYGKVCLLHAELSSEEQHEALSPAASRKIILATNIAESSVTIPGVTAVIDSGIQRESHYSPWHGLKTVEDRPITQSSAIQRAGRAGRTAPGECFRLYAEQDFKNREPFTIPEILRADLTDTVLFTKELKAELDWFTPPPAERWNKAQELGLKLGALSEDGSLTPIGHEILSYPVGARLARALIAAKNCSVEQKRKLLSVICEEIEHDRQGILFRRLNFYLKDSGPDKLSWENALLTGFIDQVAKFRRKQHDFIHYSGKTIKLHHSLKDLGSEYYLVLDITQRQEAISIIPIEEEWLLSLEPFPFHEEQTVSVDEKFSLKTVTKLGSIVMDENEQALSKDKINPDLLSRILVQGQRNFEKRWSAWQASEEFLKFHFWARYKKQVWSEIEAKINLASYLQWTEEISWDKLESYFLEQLAQLLSLNDLPRELPSQINLGGKRELKVTYPLGLDPYVEAPIQDFYGVKETPTIGKERIPLIMKLLGPHKMPLQVTKDIKSFWSKTYLEMKRELEREYPRHHWPENPAEARPILLKRQL